MGTNYASFVAGMCLFCYERDFMLSLLDDNQCEVIGLKLSIFQFYFSH